MVSVGEVQAGFGTVELAGSGIVSPGSGFFGVKNTQVGALLVLVDVGDPLLLALVP